ncbi:hypothetical protein KAF25_006873 [Fusarium avenaceum]|uniref:Fungal N-terminal domain-containing protein n=1 Tax=Fusarium avenaceum TaxID=40199 RepID=A0A9P7GU39_9HYPO|nr:hypothetical protein KAF25_006873 [Fusarium avenaceum]
MAEALGITSGAAGLLSLAIEVTKLSYTYIASVRGAPKSLTSYIGELATLTSVLLQLDDVIQSKKINSQNIQILNKALNDCKQEVESLRTKLERKVSYGGIKARVAALAWPLSESELLDKVNMLHRYNGIFSSALQADTLTIAIATNKELQDFRNSTETKEIIACALVLRDIKSGNLPGTAIASHFFSSNRSTESVSNVLRNLITQALRGCPVIPQEALDLYEKRSQNLTMNDLINVFGAIAKSMTTCIVLDGLDECPFLPKLFNILSTLQELGVRIFATGRDLPKIRKHFEKKPSVEVSATNHDLDLYVNHRLKDGEVDVELIGRELTSDLISAIEKKTAGSFLLARFIMDHITSLLTIKDIRKALISLPANYKEAYLGTFERIVKQSPALRELALRSLNFICYVKEPLRMVELQHGLATEEGMLEIDPEDLQASKTITSSCLGLLVVSGSEKTVEFVHSTAREFLHSRPEGMDKRPHLAIVRSCISYMSTNEMRQGLSNFYGYHAEEVIEECFDQLSKFLEDDALRESSWQLLNFKAHLDTSVSESVFDSSPRNVLALHVAAFWGFYKYVANSVDDSQPGTQSRKIHNLNAPDSHGWTPLHWAVSMGHKSIVEILLRSGASPDLPDLAGWTPTFWAAFKGHANIIEVLWRYDIAPFRCDNKGLTPLHWAISTGQTEIVKRLLKVKTRFGQYEKSSVISLPSWEDLTVSRARAMTTKADQSPFKFYSESSDIEMFSTIFNALKQSFIEKADKPRESNSGYYTVDPFLYGPFGRSLKGDYGRRARPDRDYEWGKPDANFLEFVDNLMIHATRSQNLPIIKLVFDLKLVKPSGIDGLGLLLEAATSGWLEGMSALIDLGADVNNGRQKDGKTPLHGACLYQSEKSVSLLLSNGKIDINARDKYRQTPIMDLMTASFEEKGLDLYKLLIARGASTSIKDAEGNSLMHFAMQTCNATMVQMLCEAESSIESPNKSGQLPLHWMADWRYFEFRKDFTPDEAQFLKKKRRDCMNLVLKLSSLSSLDSVCDWKHGATPSKQTPLLLALSSHNWDLAVELMKSIKKPGNTSSLLEPAHYFCQGGFLIAPETSIENEETRYLQVLRQNNAINYETRSGRTLIFEAAGRGNTQLVERLLDHGAYPHYIDDFGSSALHAAAKKQAPTTVAALLQAGADVHQVSLHEFMLTGRGTPLYACLEACSHGRVSIETVRILLSYGADPNYTAARDDYAEMSLSLPLKALRRSIDHPDLETSNPEHVEHLALEVMKLLVDAGARVADSADDITIGVVAKMDGYESLWEEMRSQLLADQAIDP